MKNQTTQIVYQLYDMCCLVVVYCYTHIIQPTLLSKGLNKSLMYSRRIVLLDKKSRSCQTEPTKLRE